jgi:glycosyltransferase involved in cell wall biosynthesis
VEYSEGRKIRIAILAHEFLINIGANDFLKNIIRGLALEKQNEIIFLCPGTNKKIEHFAPENTKNSLRKIPYLKWILRMFANRIGPTADKFVKHNNYEDYKYYKEACPNMKFITCDVNARSLCQLKEDEDIDIFLPSIHAMPKSLPYVTYWPDCQPKHFPEFFDDEAQCVRDKMILELLSTGKPMIINSKDAKDDMCKFYNANPNQIFNLPFAPIVEFEKLIPRPELRLAYNLTRPFFIICNQFWIHKSLDTVIEAGAIVKEKGIDVDFIFTGKMEEPRKPGYVDSLMQMVSDFDLNDIIKFLGYIPKDDQLELIKGALAVIQPTLFEGGPGGGSVYDAVSLGVRAIVSDIPINKELPISDNHIILFKRKNAQDLVDKIELILESQYQSPSSEELYQNSKTATQRLAKRLYEAIYYELSKSPEING